MGDRRPSFSVAIGLVYLFSGIKVDFDLTARDILLVYFFTVIGLNAHVGDLARGGRPLAILLAVTVAFMPVANVVLSARRGQASLPEGAAPEFEG